MELGNERNIKTKGTEDTSTHLTHYDIIIFLHLTSIHTVTGTEVSGLGVLQYGSTHHHATPTNLGKECREKCSKMLRNCQ